MSTLKTRIASLERALRPQQAPSGTIEYHHPAGAQHDGGLLPCDKRDQHGPDCVMSVSPTNSGVRLMRIIEGMEGE